MGAALDQFKESLDLAGALKKLEKQHFPAVPRIDQQPFVKGLRGGAAVLMVAAFEFFLRKLFEDNISNLNSVPVFIDFGKLPRELRVKAVFAGLDRAMKGPRYGPKLSRNDRIPAVIDEAKLLINDHINPETFSETNSNPNGDTVAEKFKEVGLADVFAKIRPEFDRKWGSPEAENFVKDKLNEIVRTRNVVAHTTDTLNITRKSLNDAVKFLKILAEVLEKTLENHIRDLRRSAKK